MRAQYELMQTRIQNEEQRIARSSGSASQHSHHVQESRQSSANGAGHAGGIGVFNDDLAEEAKYTFGGRRMEAPVPNMLRDETHNSGSGNVIGNVEDFEN